MATSKGEQAKNKLIQAAARLFIKQGYHATGIQEIIDSAGISKGSFYFYFKTKQVLALEVHAYFNEKTLKALEDFAEHHPWNVFVSLLYDWILDKTIKNKNYGCPFAVLGTETAFSAPQLSRLYYASILKGTQIFSKAFINAGVDENTAMARAEKAFAVYEGYMLRYRLSQKKEELEKLQEALLQM